MTQLARYSQNPWKKLCSIEKTKALVAAICLLATMGCSGTAAATVDPPAAIDAPMACAAPVILTVHRDLSRSTGANGIPDVTVSDLQTLVEDVVGVCGGELLYGEIGVNSARPFHRIRIEEPPAYPVAPAHVENPFERAKRNRAFAKQVAAWKNRRDAWAGDATARAATFLERATPSLARKADENATDIEGAVSRAVLALEEPQSGWSRTPLRVMLLATDGIHTTTRRSGQPPASDIMIVVAGAPGVLIRFNPVVFENTASAIRHISATARANSK